MCHFVTYLNRWRHHASAGKLWMVVMMVGRGGPGHDVVKVFVNAGGGVYITVVLGGIFTGEEILYFSLVSVKKNKSKW